MSGALALDLEKLRIRLEVLKQFREQIDAEIKALEADLQRAQQFTYHNTFTFQPALPVKSGLWKSFLHPRVLEAHRQKGEVEYESVQQGEVIVELRWTAVDVKHDREILNACKWVLRRLIEDQNQRATPAAQGHGQAAGGGQNPGGGGSAK